MMTEEAGEEEVNLGDSTGGGGEVVLSEFTVSGEKVMCSIGPPSSTLSQSTTSSRAPSLTTCARCQRTETDSQNLVAQLRSQFETDFARLKKELESATKTKESIVMKYATSEVEVLKLKKSIENSEKTIKQLNSELEVVCNECQWLRQAHAEILNDVSLFRGKEAELLAYTQQVTEKNVALQSDQSALAAKNASLKDENDRLVKRMDVLNAGEEEVNLGDSTGGGGEVVLSEFTVSGEKVMCSIGPPSSTLSQSTTSSRAPSPTPCARCQRTETDSQNLVAQLRSQFETDFARLKKELESTTKTKESIVMKYATSEVEVLNLKKSIENSEKTIKQLNSELEVVCNECQSLRQAHAEILNDISLCRRKEAELLAYTQQVTEKNVALQSDQSALAAKNASLKDENDRLVKRMDVLNKEINDLRIILSESNRNQLEAKQCIENDATSSKKVIEELQQKLDEARGEIGLLNRKLNTSIRELSKELLVARKQVKDGHSGSDALSQSSRTSSSTSLTNGESISTVADKPSKSGESPVSERSDQECPVIPDQQVLIEKIVKLQKMLAKKQDKIEFLQEHVKHLVEVIQQKSK